MQSEQIRRYQENFIKTMKMIMAAKNISTYVAAAAWLGIGNKTMLKIMSGGQAPTTEHGILLCEKAGISANWLFLGKGELYYEESATLLRIEQEIKNLAAKTGNLLSKAKG